MKVTPSQVKNIMRRGLRLLVDPEPDALEKQRCIGFFYHCCAYCGVVVAKGEGDLDHLVSASIGGRNHISNRVFSCKPCNAEQKRELPWETFLVSKHGQGPVADEKRERILQWISAAGSVGPLSDEVLKVLETEASIATTAFDEACRKIRESHQAVKKDGGRTLNGAGSTSS